MEDYSGNLKPSIGQSSNDDMLQDSQPPTKKPPIHRGGLRAVLIGSLLVLILMSVSAFAGYKWEHKRATKLENNQQAQITSLVKQLSSSQNTHISNEYLDIKPWSVKLTLPSSISDATYILLNNAWDNHPTAFLSTATLDNSPACHQKYASDPAHPTFQWVVQYGLSETVYPDQTPNSAMTAQQAIKKCPTLFKQVGSHVYEYEHGNGSPCTEETPAMVNAFQSAFDSLSVNN